METLRPVKAGEAHGAICIHRFSTFPNIFNKNRFIIMLSLVPWERVNEDHYKMVQSQLIETANGSLEPCEAMWSHATIGSLDKL